jgi:hypothetical protein
MHISELTNLALNWAVARANGNTNAFGIDGWNPSTNWAQGGPIIEREGIELKYLGYDNPPYWGALKFSPSKYERQAAVGPTPLIAAMRCFVASKLGDEIDIPNELI